MSSKDDQKKYQAIKFYPFMPNFDKMIAVAPAILVPPNNKLLTNEYASKIWKRFMKSRRQFLQYLQN